MQERYRGYRAFRIMIIASCAVILAVSAIVFDPKLVPWLQLFPLVLAAAISELAPVEIDRRDGQSSQVVSQVTLTLPIVIITGMLYGPLAVIVVCLCAFFAANILSWMSAYLFHRFPVPAVQQESLLFKLRALILRTILPTIGRAWIDMPPAPFSWKALNLVFNAAHLGVNAAVSAYEYLLVGGQLLGSPELQSSSVPWLHTALAGSVSLMFLFMGDFGIYVIASSLIERSTTHNPSFRAFFLRCNIQFRQTFPSVLRADIFLSVLTSILISMYVQIGMVAIAVLFVPLYMVREAVSKTFMQVQTYRDTVTTLGTYMQRYHPYTRGHLKRVADMSERLARELRLPADSIMLMPDAGMLHDIGKVAVSEEILDKIGRLTDEEWSIIKQHPVKGAEIVSHLPYLDKIVDWVKYHHKWVDGSGYPDDRVKDGQIPIEAAIIAVADAFDAMTDDRDMSIDWVCDSCGYDPEDGSRPDVCPECGMQKHRVYRQPLSLDDAVDQLRRGAGTQFSPRVVKAFLRMLERDGVHVNA